MLDRRAKAQIQAPCVCSQRLHGRDREQFVGGLSPQSPPSGGPTTLGGTGGAGLDAEGLGSDLAAASASYKQGVVQYGTEQGSAVLHNTVQSGI